MTIYHKDDLHHHYEQHNPLHPHIHRAMLAASQNYSMANYDGHLFHDTEYGDLKIEL